MSIQYQLWCTKNFIAFFILRNLKHNFKILLIYDWTWFLYDFNWLKLLKDKFNILELRLKSLEKTRTEHQIFATFLQTKFLHFHVIGVFQLYELFIM